MLSEIIYVNDFGQPFHRGRAETMARDGSSAVELNDYPVYSVRWSNNGLKVAVTTENFGRVAVQDPNGDNTILVNSTGPSYGNYLPGGDFSPDSGKYCCARGAGGGLSVGIDVFDFAGTSGVSFIALGNSGGETITGGGGSGQSVVWRPGGGFAYIAQSPITSQQEIRTCNADGSGVATILPGTELAGQAWWGLCDAFDDGSLLVMLCPQDTGAGQLIHCAADGGSRDVLFDDPTGTLIGHYNESGAAVSSDGNLIAVACRDHTIRTCPATGGPLGGAIASNSLPFGSVAWAGDPPPVATSSIAAGAHTTGIIRLG